MADIQAATLSWAKGRFSWLADPIGEEDFHVGGVTPSDLQGRFPFLRVQLGGGTRTRRELLPVLDVDLFDSDRDRAYHHIEEIQDALLEPLLQMAGVRIDSVGVEEDIRQLPWDADRTIRFGFTNQLSLRR